MTIRLSWVETGKLLRSKGYTLNKYLQSPNRPQSVDEAFTQKAVLDWIHNAPH